MRLAILLAASALGFAQALNPAYEPLARAYRALAAGDYDGAIGGFQQGIEIAPARASIRKDLGYAYLKIGENELARDQFGEAMRLEPSDSQVALEFAFLCYEQKEQAQARRIFDRIRKTGAADSRATAEQAFQNIDAPLAAGIARWKKAIEMDADQFSAHFELATLAEQRDELELAAKHYERAWRLAPSRRSVMVDLGRVWKALNRNEEANAVLLAASRGGEPRAAEMALELLPGRYPYVFEFRRALEMDPANLDLRRELGFLLLRMDRQPEAEQEFRVLTNTAPHDLLSAAQLGFLLLARGERDDAMPLLERVLAGKDEDLANRVRAVLRISQMPGAGAPEARAIDAKEMALRSIRAGYLKDAARYLEIAHDLDPADFDVMLRLGWTYNILHQDVQAVRWFDLARRSPDPKIASQAARSWRHLRGVNQRFRLAAWIYPLFSTRWHDLFSYGQVKVEMRTGLPIRPYISTRLVGDTRVSIGAAPPQYLSESSFILGAGVTTVPWHGITGWAEAGSAVGYLRGHMLPDYRGGLSVARARGHGLTAESPGWFADASVDAVFLSRFGNDFLVYEQGRCGYTAGPQALRAQLYWNGNMTVDAKGRAWANFVETGPGVRLSATMLPESMHFSFNLLRGAYVFHASDAPRERFNDFRVGVWYAFTR